MRTRTAAPILTPPAIRAWHPAGMGDVLTGVLAGFITQGFTPEAAAHASVYLHGAAADTLSKTIGPIGYLAGEVMNAIPAEIKKLMQT